MVISMKHVFLSEMIVDDAHSFTASTWSLIIWNKKNREIRFFYFMTYLLGRYLQKFWKFMSGRQFFIWVILKIVIFSFKNFLSSFLFFYFNQIFGRYFRFKLTFRYILNNAMFLLNIEKKSLNQLLINGNIYQWNLEVIV